MLSNGITGFPRDLDAERLRAPHLHAGQKAAEDTPDVHNVFGAQSTQDGAQRV
jgi:hypothetical protein